jgi:predicted phosphodiesterase
MGLVTVVALSACSGSPTSRHLVAVGDAIRVSIAAADTMPADWQTTAFADHAWSAQVTAFAPSLAGVAMPADVDVRRTFDIGADYPAFTTLTLSFSPGAAYNVFLNGQSFGSSDGSAPLTITPPANLLRASGNVLALSVHATGGAPLSIAPTLDGSADPKAMAGDARIVRGPWLLSPTASGATIAWETSAAVASIAVVDGKSYDGGAGTHHVAPIDGLLPSHAYGYHVEAGAARSDDAALTTAPADKSARVRFVVYGDNRTDGDAHRRVVDAIAGEGADFLVNTGDMVNASSDTEWQTFFDIEYSLIAHTPLFPSLGNHEHDSGGDARFTELFPLGRPDVFKGRVYSFDYGSVHVAVLDSNSNLADQAPWLDTDLSMAEAAGARHEFVVMHWGAYSGRSYLMHGSNMDARKYIEPIARKHRVDALLAGHDHFYERGNANGLHYFVTGGGGAPLADTGAIHETDLAKKMFHYLVFDVVGDVAHVVAKDPSGAGFDAVDLSHDW